LLSKFDVEKISKKSSIVKKGRIETILRREVMSPLMLEEFKKMNIICLAKTIKMPTLIIHGKKDELIPESHGEYLHFNMENSKFILIDSDHNANSQKDASIIGKHCQAFAGKLKEKFLK
jgi:pimeloyl-ACP methyl ester carboxylesterase